MLKRRQLGILFLVTCLNLTTVPPVLGEHNSNVITVAADGSGDFNCDGSNAHEQINKALDYAASHGGGTVRLKGPVTYEIRDSLRIGSNTVLEGDSGAKIKLAPGLSEWGGPGSSIPEKKAMLMIKGNSAKDVTIKDLTVDGSQKDYYPNVRMGTSRYNMATLVGADGLKIQNVNFQNGINDAVLTSKSSNIDIDRITVNNPGHAGVYAYDVRNIEVRNSKFINRGSSSTRFDAVTNGKFENNYMTSYGWGQAGLQLEEKLKNIEVRGNHFDGVAGAPIEREGYPGSNINIYDNKVS